MPIKPHDFYAVSWLVHPVTALHCHSTILQRATARGANKNEPGRLFRCVGGRKASFFESLCAGCVILVMYSSPRAVWAQQGRD